MTIEKDLRPIKLLLKQRKGSLKTVDLQEQLYGKSDYYTAKRERIAEQWRVRILAEINSLVSGAETCLKILQSRPPYRDTATEKRRLRKQVEKWERRVQKYHAIQSDIRKEIGA